MVASSYSIICHKGDMLDVKFGRTSGRMILLEGFMFYLITNKLEYIMICNDDMIDSNKYFFFLTENYSSGLPL